jgi:hypothetical protein
VWRRLCNRVNKLVAALDEYTAACDAVVKQLGLPEAEHLGEELYVPILEIVDRMEAIEPRTIQGFQAKATMLLKWYWADKDGDQLAGGDGVAFDIVKGLANAQLAA